MKSRLPLLRAALFCSIALSLASVPAQGGAMPQVPQNPNPMAGLPEHPDDASTDPLLEECLDEVQRTMFPDTPVALATLANGRKQLIFPRPADQKRFLTRL